MSFQGNAGLADCLAPDSNSSLIDNPKPAGNWLTLQRHEGPLEKLNYVALVLPSGTKDDEARIMVGWVRNHVGEIQIESDENSVFSQARRRNDRIRLAAKVLVEC